MDWTIVVHMYSLMLIMMTMFIPLVAIILMSRGLVRTARFTTRRNRKR